MFSQGEAWAPKSACRCTAAALARGECECSTRTRRTPTRCGPLLSVQVAERDEARKRIAAELDLLKLSAADKARRFRMDMAQFARGNLPACFAKAPRRIEDRGVSTWDNYQRCAWPYTQFSVPHGTRPPQTERIVPVLTGLPAQWPPRGCGQVPDAEIRDSGGTLQEARRNPAFFPQPINPYSRDAAEAVNRAPEPTSLGDLVRSNGHALPAREIVAPPPVGARPKTAAEKVKAGLSAADDALDVIDLCDDPEALGQRCTWPFSIASVPRLKQEGPEGYVWVRLKKGAKASWPPVGCRYGPTPVVTWWILDFLRGFLGLQNPPLNLQPAPIGGTPAQRVAQIAGARKAMAPAAPGPAPDPVKPFGECRYVWRWRGVGNPAETIGPPAVDPTGLKIYGQPDYARSEYVLVSWSGGTARECGVSGLRSKG